MLKCSQLSTCRIFHLTGDRGATDGRAEGGLASESLNEHNYAQAAAAH